MGLFGNGKLKKKLVDVGQKIKQSGIVGKALGLVSNVAGFIPIPGAAMVGKVAGKMSASMAAKNATSGSDTRQMQSNNGFGGGDETTFIDTTYNTTNPTLIGNGKPGASSTSTNTTYSNDTVVDDTEIGNTKPGATDNGGTTTGKMMEYWDKYVNAWKTNTALMAIGHAVPVLAIGYWVYTKWFKKGGSKYKG